ncbi:RrF2 family transcriptional regulator [Parasphaerochaeta coccoides]|uniref:Transcriptional regulator, BadM/Rrf2 family n=1 Tax=Parasphaerochaeta coccoides (strain ATCC BAA-1237 / DSM 17374 / SPN1) TaxID=760011 RepID=F4GK31_PARC1|nr:Rrf2 family transcriptional regulator [Parasphaerochaeta coccoides]AEC01803.1 transcriptional regulator, BadM/Rrf2 family [Parasphaerochaeta coccoides DSM 17374]
MRISTRGRYSLEALLFIALVQDAESIVSAHLISEKTGISYGYLEQLFIPLKRTRIIKGSRGAKGGYRIASDLDKITVGDILRSVENSLKDSSRPDSAVRQDISNPIPKVKETWAELHDTISGFIDSLTLADVVSSYHKMNDGEYMI